MLISVRRTFLLNDFSFRSFSIIFGLGQRIMIYEIYKENNSRG
ncbi:MAG: hypothetical protein H6Q64_425 [Firmicutes bacterium]|nr:hypothetical protein [Bacillota bacterium]